MRRNIITLTLEKNFSRSKVYRVLAYNEIIGYFVLPEEIFISKNDPFIVEKIESINDEVRQYLMKKLNMPKKEGKAPKAIIKWD